MFGTCYFCAHQVFDNLQVALTFDKFSHSTCQIASAYVNIFLNVCNLVQLMTTSPPIVRQNASMNKLSFCAFRTLFSRFATISVVIGYHSYSLHLPLKLTQRQPSCTMNEGFG